LDAYLARYSSPRSRHQNAISLNHLFRHTGRRHPAEVSEAELFGWVRARAERSGPPSCSTDYRSLAFSADRSCPRSDVSAQLGQ
jgi:hypothetical protein